MKWVDIYDQPIILKHMVDNIIQPLSLKLGQGHIFLGVNKKMKKSGKKSFGSLFKELRQENGFSIKKLGAKLDINYSYISKLENNHTVPSEDFIRKIAGIFDYDQEELMLRAGKIPDDIVDILRNNPKEAVKFLRKQFEDR